MSRGPAVVVPIHDAPGDVERCLAALARWRPPDSLVVLVDDASRDPRIAPMLAAFASAHAGVQVIAQEANAGFVATSNRGAAAAPGRDLVFLNSDAQVAEGWWEEISAAVADEPRAGVCCPLSNNATILSVPRFQQGSPLPGGLDADAMARVVRACAGELRRVEIPTAVGFCLWVRRATWDRLGPFDPAFGAGYGEDDDLAQRVRANGEAVLCAPRAFVYHRGSASFGANPGVSERRSANGRLLLARWPDYAVRTRAWCRANPLRAMHERLWEALLAPKGRDFTHVLHVLPHWEARGPLRDRMLQTFASTQASQVHTVVVPMPDGGQWLDLIDGEVGQNYRVCALLDFENRLDGFIAASPATEVRK